MVKKPVWQNHHITYKPAAMAQESVARRKSRNPIRVNATARKGSTARKEVAVIRWIEGDGCLWIGARPGEYFLRFLITGNQTYRLYRLDRQTNRRKFSGVFDTLAGAKTEADDLDWSDEMDEMDEMDDGMYYS